MARGGDHPLLHVMVVGFHHKKGCQIEYSYPPFDGGESFEAASLKSELTAQSLSNGAPGTSTSRLRNSFSIDMPEDWRRLLPSLALPDGAHHWSNDAVFFTLPSRDVTTSSTATVFGISCCRQIDAKELTRGTDEITRNTVQKSICVLSTIPAYGLVEAHMKPVTQAYFEQKDFEQKEILKDLFQQLVTSLTLQLPNSPSTPPRSALAYMQEDSQLFIGLSARDFVLRFRHNFLLLVKLVLLEKRVLFYGPPSKTNVYALSGETILTLLSLFPKMIEDGLYFACEVPDDIHDNPEGAIDDDDDDDDAGLSLKSGPQSLSEDYLVVTRRPGKEEGNLTVGDDASGDIVSDPVFLPEKDVGDRLESMKVGVDNSPSAITLTTTTCEEGGAALAYGEESNEQESTSATASRSSNLKASLKAPRKRMNGGNGFDRSASPLCLPKEDNHLARGHGKEDYLLDAETQSLSSLCVEPPLSVNDNLDDRMDDLSLDEELEEMRAEALEELGVDESVAFSTDIPESSEKNQEEFSKANDTGEDALLDEIDQIMSASSKGPEKLGLDAGSQADPNDFGAGAILSPEEEMGAMRHSESKASILSERSANLASRASVVKSKLFDVWKGNWGFGNGGGEGCPTESGGGSKANSRSTSPSKSDRADRGVTASCGDDLSQSPSVEHLSAEFPGERENSSKLVKPEITKMSQDAFGFPSAVFEQGYLCLPYASLQHFDVIQDKNVRGFLIGATNILFKQKSKMTDVVVTVENPSPAEESKIEENVDGNADETVGNTFEFDWRDQDLKRLVMLTTADLRFADDVLRQVEAVEDSSTWEGGDEWIRSQIKTYLQSILVTSIKGDQHQLHDFNAAFVFAWQNTTRNYKVWHGRATVPDAWPGLDTTVQPPHPGASPHLSVNDIKLKMSHTISSSNSGRKITAAAATTGKAVVSTSKAVGGAIYSARSSISSWWHGGKRTKVEEENDVDDAMTSEEM